jgi:predicted amidophosphoribosyltransferase
VDALSTWTGFLDALFPPACWLCGVGIETGWFCGDHALPERPRGQRCLVCGLELPLGLANGVTCGPCRESPPPWAHLVSLGEYHGHDGLRAGILALKHGGRSDLCLPLGRCLARRLEESAEGSRVDLLVPVPLHPLRTMQRGHDQALGLARSVGAALNRPVRRSLRRLRPTSAQGTARAESLWAARSGRGRGGFSRAANVHDAFALEAGEGRRLAGRHVWLVDDVVTSGHTARECSTLLRRAGAESVGLLCLARASLSSHA